MNSVIAHHQSLTHGKRRDNRMFAKEQKMIQNYSTQDTFKATSLVSIKNPEIQNNFQPKKLLMSTLGNQSRSVFQKRRAISNLVLIQNQKKIKNSIFSGISKDSSTINNIDFSSVHQSKNFAHQNNFQPRQMMNSLAERVSHLSNNSQNIIIYQKASHARLERKSSQTYSVVKSKANLDSSRSIPRIYNQSTL